MRRHMRFTKLVPVVLRTCENKKMPTSNINEHLMSIGMSIQRLELLSNYCAHKTRTLAQDQVILSNQALHKKFQSKYQIL